ncbi:hypothetical protein AA13595_2334 [Gluconacetobacter johannae DSM 13595]|nr:hypothetical protein AA13595_2334 [Gluconacetobacter johannae DSM 13595]
MLGGRQSVIDAHRADYVAFVIDVFARYIVGWRVSRTARAGFVLDALKSRLRARGSARASAP